MRKKDYLTDAEMAQRSIDNILANGIEPTIKKLIEQGIREHLVITIEVGVKYSVNKIYKLLEPHFKYNKK